MYFCGFCLLSCNILYKIDLVMSSDLVYIDNQLLYPVLKPTPVSVSAPGDPAIESIPNLFDGNNDTSYNVHLPLELVLDLGGTIPFNTLELSKLLGAVPFQTFQLYSP